MRPRLLELIQREAANKRPGVAGRTENIRVRSIVGRMFRNLSKRVEAVAPIFDTEGRGKLWEALEICLRDRRQAWVLDQDGMYTQLRPDGAGGDVEAQGTHETLMTLARRRSE